MAESERNTQKATVIGTLAAFSETQENASLLMAADCAFGEWDNEDDQVYDAF
jgi:hypothetical protein